MTDPDVRRCTCGCRETLHRSVGDNRMGACRRTITGQDGRTRACPCEQFELNSPTPVIGGAAAMAEGSRRARLSPRPATGKQDGG